MRASICIASLALVLAAASLRADGPLLRPRNSSDLFQMPLLEKGLKDSAVADQSGLSRPGATTTERIAQWLVMQRKRGDGRGGNVDALQAVQTEYSHPENGNVVLLLWNEETPNLAGITVSVVDENGEILIQGTINGLPGANLPGTNLIPIRTLPSGLMTFIVEGTGVPASSQTEFEVLDEQPFADVTDFTCSEGTTNNLGNCDMILTWDTPAPLPTEHWILIDATPGDGVGPDLLGITASGQVDFVSAGQVIPELLPPGDYEMTNLGFLSAGGENLYRGQFITANCSLECLNLSCLAPVNLTVCQRRYSAEEDNELRVSWANVGDYVGIDVFVDEAFTGELPGDQLPELIDISPLPPGEHTIGIQAVCGVGSVADVVESSIAILEATPHTNPIEGNLSCEFLLADPAADPPLPDRTVTTWTNADPSVFIDICVEDAAGNRFDLGTLPGDFESVTINNTTPGDTIFLQFFRMMEDGNCYGSDFFFCQPAAAGNIFVRGGCDGGGGTPQITSAVFGLDFLFGGGASVPPCVEACDTNADGNVNISDMVQILNFLFGGGAPPAGWPDVNGICETAVENCETGLESCPF